MGRNPLELTEEQRISRRRFLKRASLIAGGLAGLTGLGFLIDFARKTDVDSFEYGKSITEKASITGTNFIPSRSVIPTDDYSMNPNTRLRGLAMRFPEEYNVTIVSPHASFTVDNYSLFEKAKTSPNVTLTYAEVFKIIRTYKGIEKSREFDHYAFVSAE